MEFFRRFSLYMKLLQPLTKQTNNNRTQDSLAIHIAVLYISKIGPMD